MSILLRQVQIVDPSSPFHLQQKDVLIKNGEIVAIQNSIETPPDEDIVIENLCICPGWVDIFSHFCDPGFENKETLETGALAAVSGGYTDVFVLPNTFPALHSKSAIEYIVQKGKQLPVNVYPIAAVTKNTEGKELAEMYDMHASGAAAFSDGINCIQSAGILLKAFQYIKAINKTLIQLPDDNAINANGLMNEGIFSTQLGLPGKPAIGEELIIARDLELVKYTNSQIHFTGISTKKAVELIRQAKTEGLPVTCSVTPYHLFFSDADLVTYNANLKVNPPLRTAEDREALRSAVTDGTVDCISSHHIPQDMDSKMVEFEYAKDGMIGLQTAFAAVRSCIPELSLERITEVFSTNARKIFNLPGISIREKNKVNLTLFDKNQNWVLTATDIASKSKNSPFIGRTLTGRAIGIINKDKLFLSKGLRRENQ
ncbi:MAG: dihydroorotase family protein [Chitinophagaceae bacterium]